MPFLIVPLLWIAAAAGCCVNGLLCASPGSASPLERSLFGLATGLGLLAYGTLALGLLGLLSPVPFLFLCLMLAALGGPEHLHLAREVSERAKTVVPRTVAGWLLTTLFAVFAAVALIGCFTPPTAIEWDSLSYHLADPKIYLRLHRIAYLPWESHSNFAFTMEMLYALGLMAHSIPLAKLFHFATGVVGTLALYRLGARLVSPMVGALAALLFVTMPLAFWEAGTAYVDLAATAFGTLGLLALATAMTEGDAADTGAWMRASAIMMGWMLSVKATSAIPAFLFALAWAYWIWQRRRSVAAALQAGAVYGLIALGIGCVWYVKSWIVTGNPVYPFAYSAFPHSHYWSASNAAQYAGDQAIFGVGHAPADLLLAPWNLTMYLLPGHPPPAGHPKPFNDFQTPIAALSPVFLALLFVPAFLRSPVPRAIIALCAFALVSLAIWFVLTQQVRYLLPVMPVFCLIAAYFLVELWEQTKFSRIVGAAFAAMSLLFSLLVAGLLVADKLPVVFGQTTSDAYVARGLESYAAIQYLNTQVPAEGGVVCYGEPRGFYLNRPYLWGEPGHSLYVPYDKMRTPGDLRAWFLARGYRYVLWNRQYAPFGPGEIEYGLTAGSKKSLLFEAHGVSVYAL